MNQLIILIVRIFVKLGNIFFYNINNKLTNIYKLKCVIHSFHVKLHSTYFEKCFPNLQNWLCQQVSIILSPLAKQPSQLSFTTLQLSPRTSHYLQFCINPNLLKRYDNPNLLTNKISKLEKD